MKMPCIIRKKRAVSPILAAILLIGLAVAAGAVLFVVVLPLITAPGGSLSFAESEISFTSTTAKIALSNDGTKTIAVKNIIIEADNDTTAGFEVTPVINFIEFNVNVGSSQIKQYTYSEAIGGTITKWKVTVTFTVGDDPTTQTITAEFTV